jgi:hypothetical protein
MLGITIRVSILMWFESEDCPNKLKLKHRVEQSNIYIFFKLQYYNPCLYAYMIEKEKAT